MASRMRPMILGVAMAVALGVGGATVVLAQAGGEQVVKERSDLMKAMSANNKIVAAAVKSGEFDAKMIKAAEDISASAGKIPVLFPQGTGDDKLRTRARAAIWQEKDKFDANAKALASGYAAVAAAAKSGNKGELAASFKKAADTCGSCHKAYRGPELK